MADLAANKEPKVANFIGSIKFFFKMEFGSKDMMGTSTRRAMFIEYFKLNKIIFLTNYCYLFYNCSIVVIIG